MQHFKHNNFPWSIKPSSIDIFASDGNLFVHVFICTSFNCSINVIQALYAHKLAISMKPQHSLESLSSMPMSQKDWEDLKCSKNSTNDRQSDILCERHVLSKLLIISLLALNNKECVLWCHINEQKMQRLLPISGKAFIIRHRQINSKNSDCTEAKVH